MHVAVVRDGKIIASWGNPELKTFIRSSLKPFQTLPLVEGGGIKRFQLEKRHLALTCASHSGEPAHIQTAREILHKAGRSESEYQCGCHAPIHKPSADILIREKREPTDIHNNCSGKHAGFLAQATLYNDDPTKYLDPAGSLQMRIRDRLESLLGKPLREQATDGCSAPTWFFSVEDMARLFSLLGKQESAAFQSIYQAMTSEPHLVAGTDRWDTILMKAGAGRWACKGGAEGVHGTALPDGTGIVVKCEDGNARGIPPAVCFILQELGYFSSSDKTGLQEHLHPILRNWRGLEVGRLEMKVSE